MSIITATPPDSETEVIVSVDEEVFSAPAAENALDASQQAEAEPAVEGEPVAREEKTITAGAEDEEGQSRLTRAMHLSLLLPRNLRRQRRPRPSPRVLISSRL